MSFTQLAPLINTLGLLVLAAAIWFTQWRSGSSQVSAQVISNYEQLTKQQKDQIEAYKGDMEKLRSTLTDSEKNFIERISKLEGQVLEKEKRAKDLELLVVNRNPELERLRSSHTLIPP
jgi:hypothetical protein